MLLASKSSLNCSARFAGSALGGEGAAPLLLAPVEPCQLLERFPAVFPNMNRPLPLPVDTLAATLGPTGWGDNLGQTVGLVGATTGPCRHRPDRLCIA
jgi:hypothetical protein